MQSPFIQRLSWNSFTFLPSFLLGLKIYFKAKQNLTPPHQFFHFPLPTRKLTAAHPSWCNGGTLTDVLHLSLSCKRRFHSIPIPSPRRCYFEDIPHAFLNVYKFIVSPPTKNNSNCLERPRPLLAAGPAELCNEISERQARKHLLNSQL